MKYQLQTETVQKASSWRLVQKRSKIIEGQLLHLYHMLYSFKLFLLLFHLPHKGIFICRYFVLLFCLGFPKSIFLEIRDWLMEFIFLEGREHHEVTLPFQGGVESSTRHLLTKHPTCSFSCPLQGTRRSSRFPRPWQRTSKAKVHFVLFQTRSIVLQSRFFFVTSHVAGWIKLT